ncbi:MAG: class I SAM-dependent methyltransferase [Desulfobacteraceae bacterium]|jgi:SAM-dependent methyltransferase
MSKAGEKILENYYETHYKNLHGWRDYELTSKGFGQWYYDCLSTDKEIRILDLGCGDGKFLFFLQKNGYANIEGLELSSQQAEEARKHVKCPIHVVEDTSAFLQKHPGAYQIITVNDVLEHIPKQETVSFLQSAFEALEPGGNIVINVPQVSGFASLFCRYIDFTHETLFTEISLKQVLFSAGFSNIRFIPQKLPLKWTPRHLAYRLARRLWYCILKLIYTIELPAEKHPSTFQIRLVASARRPLD